MKKIKIMLLAAITLFMVQCKENTNNANNDSQTVASTEEVDNTAQNSAASQSEVSTNEDTSSKNENTNTETKQSSNNSDESDPVKNPKLDENVSWNPKNDEKTVTKNPKLDENLSWNPKNEKITDNTAKGGEWYNLKFIDFQLKKGEEMKDQYTIIASENLKYLLYLNKNNVPELGEVVNKKRQEESELVQTKAIYTFPTVKASWLKENETKFFIQKADGNLQYVNPNKSYWGLSDGRDKNKDLLHKVDKLKITDDGRIVLVDKSGTEIWSHR